MKKNFKLMLVALLAMLTSAIYAAAPAVGGTWTDDNFSYTIKAVNLVAKTGTITIAPNGTLSGEVTIPGQVTKKYDDDIYTFTMDEIPTSAFKDQTGVTKVNFPAQLTSIGAAAFEGCTLLSEITFAANSKLIEIGSKAFATTQIVNPDFTNCVVLPILPDLLFTDGTHQNSYVKTIKLPTSAVFTSFGTALADLPALESANISETQIQIVKEGAFKGTSADVTDASKGVRKVELPKTVKTIEKAAFQDSKITELTINVDAILEDPANSIGNNNNAIYGTSTTLLTKLTLKGELKGKVSAFAFNGNTALTEVDMEHMTFASKGQIMNAAFNNCTGLTKVTLGAINHNGNAGEYTVHNGAFQGCTKLATVIIGDIDTKGAIGEYAFGKNLETLTIGDVTKAGAIAPNAFEFADKTTTVTIGKVLNEDPAGAVYVFGVNAFKFKASNAASKPVNVTIGDGTKAIDSKGKVFVASAFQGNYISQLTFNGAIIEKGLDEALVGTTNLYGLDFNGPIATNGICSDVFNGVDTKGLTTVNFTGELAPLAVSAHAFLITSDYNAAKVPLLTVNYTSATHANTTASGIPFAQTTFADAPTDQRDVQLNVTNAALKATIISLQTNPADAFDVIFRVMLVPEAPSNFFNVFENSANTGTSYGRILLEAGKIYKIDRRPTAPDADGVDQTGITYTLNVVYKEEDDNSKLTKINMLPMVSNDGFYYVDLSGVTTDVVCIVKATGTTEKDTKMWYEEIASIPAGKTASNIYNGDGSVKVAHKVVTNQQLRNGAGDPEPYITYYTDPQIWGSEPLTTAVLDANDVYLLTNPANYKGEQAVKIEYAEYTTPFINKENFYVLGKKYAAGSRMVINWIGENETTAIYAVKAGKVVGSESDAIYNLQGIRVNKAQKGVYIQNGKKIVVK